MRHFHQVLAGFWGGFSHMLVVDVLIKYIESRTVRARGKSVCLPGRRKEMRMNKDNQTSRVVSQLGQLILKGEYEAGAKLTEVHLAQRFGVSRTPIRQALVMLEREGLLVREDRGFLVRRHSIEEIVGAIEVRAVLEGLAAAQIAQRRMPAGLLREFEKILEDAEGVIRKIESCGVNADLIRDYFNTNERFHAALIAGANSRVISGALAVASKTPFAAVGSMARHTDSPDDDVTMTSERYRMLLLSHLQHQDIFEALRTGNAARAEALMREHAYIAIRNLQLTEMHTAQGENLLGGAF